ncbi:hypothetical protein GCM10027059_03280 [Myceligenerans halotolerans]
MEKRHREQIVFDLVEGEHEIDVADGGRGGQGGPPRSEGGELLRDLGAAVVAGMVRARGWVSRHRVVSLVATGVAAAVVLGTAAVGTVRDRERVELLRTAPGGVESLAGPPAEAWRYVPDGATGLVSWYGLGINAVAMGGNVVFLEGEHSELNRSGLDGSFPRLRWSDADLVAVDVRSGEESWRVPLGVDPECTPPGAGGAARALDEIVCLVGRPGERSAVAVTAAGEASEARRLDPGDAMPGEVVPAWDGLVVRVHLEGDVPEVDCSGADVYPQGCVVPDVPEDRAIVVRAETARSGDEVWREVVPWNGDLEMCSLRLDDMPVPDDEPAPGEDELGVSVWASLIEVRSCGVAATFGPDGTVFPGGTAMLGDLVTQYVYDYETEESSTTVRTTAGQEVLATDGWVASAEATDGTPSDLIIVEDGQGRWTQGYRRDGTRVWETESPGGMVARVGDTGIFRSATTAVGMDLRTGRQLWEWNAADEGAPRTQPRPTTFTDGSSVMLALLGSEHMTAIYDDGTVESSDPGGIHLVAVDVDTGRTRWQAEHQDLNWFAVDGQLLSVTADGALVGHRG